jgi:uncharacterized protein (DUF849 family)
MSGFVLNFTPTGMVPTRDMTPHVPLSPEEIVAQVLECAELGANMVHLHARDEQGRPTYDKEIYARIIAGIREAREELVLCVSTSGRVHTELWQRGQVLELEGDLRPDFASLTLSSLNFPRQASINEPAMVRDLAARMLDRGIRPELECFDLGMVNVARYLIDRELVRPPFYFNLILGNLAGAQATPTALGAMIQALPDQSVWSAGGIGAAQLPAAAMALAAGGGVRIGLEDNLWADPDRTELASNAGLVRTVFELGRLLGRSPAPATGLRRRLGLPDAAA